MSNLVTFRYQQGSEDPPHEPLTWWLHSEEYHKEFLGTGVKLLYLICGNGHLGTLETHEVKQDGAIHPSVVCPAEGCDFHVWARLDGWAEHGTEKRFRGEWK